MTSSTYALDHHTPGFDEIPWFEWYQKANRWEKGLGADEPKVGEFVEVMCCWALRIAKRTGVPVYGRVTAVTDRTDDLRNSVPGRWRFADYSVRLKGEFNDRRFGSSAYLRKLSLLEALAYEALEPERQALPALVFVKLALPLPVRPTQTSTPAPFPSYSVVTFTND